MEFPEITDPYLINRIADTIGCRDCDYIPKAIDAGKIIGEHQIMHNGLRVFKNRYYDSWITYIIQELRGHHEPQEEKVFYELLKHIPENATMLELGCYWGYYSLWFQKEIWGVKNYLSDPDLSHLQVAKDNFDLNHFVGDFTVCGIPEMSVDQFLSEKKIDHLHILHSDIQGAEYEMLMGCKESFSKIDYIIISTHYDKHEPCMSALVENGFKIICSHTIEESFSGDGLIVAKNSKLQGGLGEVSISKKGVF